MPVVVVVAPPVPFPPLAVVVVEPPVPLPPVPVVEPVVPLSPHAASAPPP
ncbi:MAG TPA: hypothetical protein VL400_00100 [Polyangiaceae bacterium]|nr:hypothetical protein [Polyangiaceae bacterium]